MKLLLLRLKQAFLERRSHERESRDSTECPEPRAPGCSAEDQGAVLSGERPRKQGKEASLSGCPSLDSHSHLKVIDCTLII